MTLDDYIKELNDDVQRFRDWWAHEAECCGELHFPPGEWDEQFRSWQEAGGG